MCHHSLFHTKLNIYNSISTEDLELLLCFCVLYIWLVVHLHCNSSIYCVQFKLVFMNIVLNLLVVIILISIDVHLNGWYSFIALVIHYVCLFVMFSRIMLSTFTAAVFSILHFAVKHFLCILLHIFNAHFAVILFILTQCIAWRIVGVYSTCIDVYVVHVILVNIVLTLLVLCHLES